MLTNLYTDLMKLCAENEAFYFVDHHFKGEHYRVFTYRLASYSDFLLPGALECRGHTFLIREGVDPVLVSLPMQKFFNVGENPMTMDLDWSKVVRIDDKLDGSLISTVVLPPQSISVGRNFTLKSKTSFTSEQSVAAMRLLDTDDYYLFEKILRACVALNWTVNMEYTAPDNQIVIGYSKPSLRVLNVRDNQTGEYVEWEFVAVMFPAEFLCQSLPITKMTQEIVDEITKMEGIEGYVFTFEDGLKAKLKTDWYCALHLQKDQISNPRRLFEAVINETSDDLKGLFGSDPVALARIEEMEVKAKALYNRLHKLVESFYHENKELSRKDFAIKGQEELKKDGVFSLAMNLYIGRDMNLKEHLTKNYKSYGIIDTEHSASE